MLPSYETLKLFVSTEFLTGALFGVGALVIGAITARTWRGTTPAPVYGVLFTAATLAALPVAADVPLRLVAGCAFLAAAGAAFRLTRYRSMLAVASAVPGAIVVSFLTPVPAMGAAIWMVFAIIVVGSPLLASFDERFRADGLGPVLYTITVAAAFVVLPETSQVVVMLGVAVPLAVLGWPRLGVAVGGAGSFAVMGLYGWVVASGGAGRISSIVGGAGALGLFIALPLAQRFVGRRLSFPRSHSALRITATAVIAHSLILAVAARFAGTRVTVVSAAVIASGAIVLAAAAIATWGRWSEAGLAQVPEARDQGPV